MGYDSRLVKAGENLFNSMGTPAEDRATAEYLDVFKEVALSRGGAVIDYELPDDFIYECLEAGNYSDALTALQLLEKMVDALYEIRYRGANLWGAALRELKREYFNKVNNIEVREGLNTRKKTIGSLMQRLLSKNRYTEISFWCPDVFWEQPFFEGVVEDVPDKYTNVPIDYYEKDSGIYQIYISPEDMLPEDMKEVEEMKDYYEKHYPPVHSIPAEKYLGEGASKNRDYDTDEWSVIYYELSAETNEPSYDKVLARKALVNVPKRQKYDKVDPVNDYDLRVYAKDEESFELAKKVANAHGLKYRIEPTNKVHAARFPQEAFQLTLYIPEEKIQSQ